MIAYPLIPHTMTISLLGDIPYTDYDYYITQLETKIDTNGKLFDTKVKTFFKKIIGQEPRLDPAVTPTLSIST